MSIFDNFPLINAYSVNLDWIIKKIIEIEEYVRNYTAVNKVAYAGVWDITKQYPQWALVTDGNTSWLSNKPVPVGIPLENAEYWQKLADLDPRIAGIIVAIDKLTKDIASTNNNVATNSAEIIKLGEDLKTVENLFSVVSVLNFGAKGDGSTDDFQAFYRAISACKPHGVVVIPYTGRPYVIKDTLRILKPIKITGMYAGLEPYGAKTPDVDSATMETPLIDYKKADGYCFAVRCLGVEIENLSIKTAANGIYFSGEELTSGKFGRYQRLTNVTVYNTADKGYGVNLYNCFRFTAINVNCFGGSEPFYINGGTSHSYINCWARNFNGVGWTLKGLIYSSLTSCACDSEDAVKGRVGYSLDGCGTINLVSCGVENTAVALNVNGTRGLVASVYCANVGNAETDHIVQIGNHCDVLLSGFQSAANRKAIITGTGSLLNITTSDRITHVTMGGADVPVNYGFWSSSNH